MTIAPNLTQHHIDNGQRDVIGVTEITFLLIPPTLESGHFDKSYRAVFNQFRP